MNVALGLRTEHGPLPCLDELSEHRDSMREGVLRLGASEIDGVPLERFEAFFERYVSFSEFNKRGAVIRYLLTVSSENLRQWHVIIEYTQYIAEGLELS